MNGIRHPQICKEPWKLFTAPLKVLVYDKSKSLTIKVDAIAQHFRSGLGMTNPHEQTIKWLTATLLASHFDDQFPDYHSVYHIVKDVKEAFQSVNPQFGGSNLPHLSLYPSEPSLLPTAIYNNAYSNEGPAEWPEGPHRVRQIGDNHVPLRSNSKLLKGQVANGTGQSINVDAGANNQLAVPQMRVTPESQQMFALMARLLQSQGQGQGQSRAPAHGGLQLDLQLQRQHGIDRRNTIPVHDDSHAQAGSDPQQEPLQPPPLLHSPRPLALTDDERQQRKQVYYEDAEGHVYVDVGKGKPVSNDRNQDDQMNQMCAFAPKQHTSDASAMDVDTPGRDGAAGGQSSRMQMYEDAAYAALAARDKAKGGEARTKKAKGNALTKKPSSHVLAKPKPAGAKPTHYARPSMPTIPTSGGSVPSTLYRQGKIYVAAHRSLFRVVRDNAKPSTERRIKWSSSHKPSAQTWADALTLIDEYAKAHRL